MITAGPGRNGVLLGTDERALDGYGTAALGVACGRDRGVACCERPTVRAGSFALMLRAVFVSSRKRNAHGSLTREADLGVLQ